MLTDGASVGLGTLCVPETYTKLEEPAYASCWEAYRNYFFRPYDRPEAKYAGGEVHEIWKLMPECHLPMHCLNDPWVDIPYARFQGDCWRCARCGHEERSELILSVERTLGRLAEKTFFSPQLIESTGTYNIGRKKTNIPMMDGGFLYGALDLAETVTRILGHWHWAAQWARILFTDATSSFQELSNHYLLKQEPVRDLRMLWAWSRSLKLVQEPCAWFYTRLEKFKYIREVDEWMKKEMEGWKERGQPMVALLPMKMYVLEGVVTFG